MSIRNLLQVLTRNVSVFARGQSGASTVYGLCLVMGAFLVGGLAMDVSFAYKTRAELQIAADAAGHAALYLRQNNPPEVAKKKAIEVANGTLPPSSYGNTLQLSDIKFGSWDFASQTFKVDPASSDGVLVSTKRFASNKNPVKTFMLNFLGVDQWDVRADTVFVTPYPACLSQGFAAGDVIDVQSNNTFYSGFCLHSNEQITMTQNNTFEAGVVVSMPEPSTAESLDAANDGLKEALKSHRYKLRVLDKLSEIWNSLLSGGTYLPNYIEFASPVIIETDLITGMAATEVIGVDSEMALQESMMVQEGMELEEGKVYYVDCSNGTLTVGQDVILRNVVILTSCNVVFSNGSALENVTLMTSSVSAQSIKSTAGFRIGLSDNCAAGGGAQIITRGGASFPGPIRC